MSLLNTLKVFGLAGTEDYAKEICRHLGELGKFDMSTHTEMYHDDGESFLKSNENVRDCDVYVISSLYTDKDHRVNEKIINLLWFVGSLKDASARRVTVIIPYMAYARQDRKTKSREPIITKYMAKTFESIGVDRVITVDIHNLSALQNSFRIPVDNLDCIKLFTDYLCTTSFDGEKPLKEDSSNLVVLSPDNGGINRCGMFQDALEKTLGVEIPLAVFDKRRVEGKVKGSRIIGDVLNKRVLLFDDMIASGSTAAKAIKAAKEAGASLFAFCSTHGLFIGNANENFADVERLVVTDTVSTWRLNDAMKSKIKVVSTTKLMSNVIQRTHFEGGSISKLLEI